MLKLLHRLSPRDDIAKIIANKLCEEANGPQSEAMPSEQPKARVYYKPGKCTHICPILLEAILTAEQLVLHPGQDDLITKAVTTSVMATQNYRQADYRNHTKLDQGHGLLSRLPPGWFATLSEHSRPPTAFDKHVRQAFAVMAPARKEHSDASTGRTKRGHLF